MKTIFKSEHKRTNYQKVERQTQNKQFDFERKTQPKQKKNKTVIKQARKVELKQNPLKKRALSFTLIPGLTHQRGRPAHAL